MTPSGMAALANPLQSAVPKNAPVTPLQSALTKHWTKTSLESAVTKKPGGGAPPPGLPARDVFACLSTSNNEVHHVRSIPTRSLQPCRRSRLICMRPPPPRFCWLHLFDVGWHSWDSFSSGKEMVWLRVRRCAWAGSRLRCESRPRPIFPRPGGGCWNGCPDETRAVRRLRPVGES